MSADKQNKKQELLAKDCVTAFRLIVPFIIFFEASMILVQLSGLSAEFTSGGMWVWYMCSYVVLLAASIAALLLLRKVEGDPARVRSVTAVYSAVLVLCALFLTWLDARQQVESVLIYVAVISLVPMICMLDRMQVFLTEAVFDLIMLFIGIRYYANVSAFIVNFIVFAVISMALGFSYRSIRKESYERQMELEELSALRRQFAYRDELTGLQNRRAFNEKLQQLESSGSDRPFTIWIFDINGLKVVNDRDGHRAGDELIRGAVRCIADGMGDPDKLYRVGGDEFAAIDFENLPGEETMTSIHEKCGGWQGELVKAVSVSMGYAASAEYPGLNASELEREADHMMYANKNAYYEGLRIRKKTN